MNMISQILFFKVLEKSMSVSIIIIIILFIRICSRKVSNPKFIYCLWLVFILKLLVPVYISSPLSIENITDRYVEDNFNLIYKGVSCAADSLGELQKAVGIYKTNEPIKKETSEYRNGKVIKETNVITDETTIGLLRDISNEKFILTVLGIIWFIGFIIFIVLMAYRNMKFKRLFVKYNYCEDKETLKIFSECKNKLHIKKDIKLLKSGVLVPILHGIFKPVILLPYDYKELFNNKELTYILLHELKHYKQKDVLFFLCTNIFKAIYWINPLMHIAVNKMEDDFEVSCDKSVMDMLEETEVIDYGMLLIKQAEINIDKLNYSSLSANLFKKNSNLKLRIKKIANYKKKKIKITSYVAAMVGILILSLILIPESDLYKEKKDYINQRPIIYAFWIKDGINIADSNVIDIMVAQMMGDNLDNENVKLINNSELEFGDKSKIILEQIWPISIIYHNNSIQINTHNIQDEAKKMQLKDGKVYVVLRCDFQYTKYFSGSIGMQALMDINSLYNLDKVRLN